MNKKLVFIFTILFLAISLVTFFAATSNVNHVCTHNHCSICEYIKDALIVNRTHLIVLFVLFFLLSISFVFSSLIFVAPKIRDFTPVTLRVRMND